MKQKPVRYPVNRRALIARVDRALRESGRVLHRNGKRWAAAKKLGEYYIMDAKGDRIVAKHVDLEQTARDLGVLTEWEVLADQAFAEGLKGIPGSLAGKLTAKPVQNRKAR